MENTSDVYEVFDCYMAHVMIQKSYKPKIGSLIQKLEMQNSLKK